MTKTLVGNFTVQNTSLLIKNLRDTDTGEKVSSLKLENVKLNEEEVFKYLNKKGKITFIVNDDETTDAKVVLSK